MTIWLVILACAVITFLIRLSFIAIFGKREMPAWLHRSLKYVPPSVLSVIAVQEILFKGDTLFISFSNTRLLAGILAAVVAWRTRSALITILFGMAVLLLLQYLLG
jgi:branched-subunit amino acid transport protein